MNQRPSHSLGLDIGGSKIAGGLFDSRMDEVAQVILATPDTYDAFLATCRKVVMQLNEMVPDTLPVGVGIAGAIDHKAGTIFAPNIPYLSGRRFFEDMEKAMARPVRFANDANCAALAEALTGAGAGHQSVFGLIMGTGVGGGFVVDGKIIGGANGVAGEIGHLPLPFRVAGDGPLTPCNCGQQGCIEKSISGPALASFYEFMSSEKADAKQIGEMALQKNKRALQILDHFYEVVAKAMIAIIHSFDPEIIVVSGGLNNLPGLYDEVPKRWGQYAVQKTLRTKFVPAHHGAMSGLHGAALLWR